MSTPVRRLHHLDAARASLLLLGLPFHVATKAFFETEPATLAFQQSLAIGLWASVTHAFRMFAFFMLAGYFAGMMRTRKGGKPWLAERARRLLLPLAASLVTLGMIQFQLQDALLHKPSPRFLGLPVALDQFWFLIVLFGFCAVYTAIPVKRVVPGAATRNAMLLSGPRSLVLLAALAGWGLVRFALEHVPAFPDAPFETLLWQQFVFHAAGFTLGVLAWHGEIGDRFFALRNRLMLPAIAMLLALYVPLDPLVRPALGKDIYPDFIGSLVLRAVELPLAYLMALALYRMLYLAIHGPNRVITFFVDGALAIYLFHLVWAMIVLPQVLALPVPPVVQWLLASAATLLLSVTSYLIVRSTNVTRVLFCGAPPRPSAIRHPEPA